MTSTVSASAKVRARNQMTIPDRIVEAAGIEEGETFVVELEPDAPDLLRLRRVRDSYAGTLGGLYGAVDAYLDEERGDW